MTSYNPEQYWHERGANYKVSTDTSLEVVNLKNITWHFTDDDALFLEVGSGYGRIYKELFFPLGALKLYTAIEKAKRKNYTMCDFVESMRYNCLRNTGRLPDYWDGKNLPYLNNQFDFVISFSVFLHVPPADIETVFAEHIRVCKKYFFVATYAGGLEKLAPHCFEHDYKKLFEKYNLKIIDEKFFQGELRANWLLEV